MVGKRSDERFVARADSDESVDAGADELASELDDFGFIDGADDVGDFGVIFDFVGFEITLSIDVGDLGDSLGRHLETPQSIAFCGGEVRLADFAV